MTGAAAASIEIDRRRLVLALIGLVVAFGQPPWRHSSVWLPLLFGAGSAAPFAIVGLVLYRRANSWALGAVSTLAWITILTSPCSREPAPRAVAKP